MKKCNTLISKVLEKEEYVNVTPSEKECFEFRLAHLLKEEIRNHKWCRGTENKSLSWDEAKKEWMDLYYKEFMNHIKHSLKAPTTKKKKAISERLIGYDRRDPVISGGSV